MFEVIREQNLITYMLGLPQWYRERPLDDCPSALLKVWPIREAVPMVTPPDIDALLPRLSRQHSHHKRGRASPLQKEAWCSLLLIKRV